MTSIPFGPAHNYNQHDSGKLRGIIVCLTKFDIRQHMLWPAVKKMAANREGNLVR